LTAAAAPGVFAAKKSWIDMKQLWLAVDIQRSNVDDPKPANLLVTATQKHLVPG